MKSFARDRRGSVITVFAFSAMIFAVLTAIVMNQISFYMSKRKLQDAVDMTTLMMMESGVITVANAQTLLEKQMKQPVDNVVVTQGRYSANSSIPEANRFIPNATPYNAVHVSAQIPAEKVMLGGMMADNPTISAAARGARRTTASIVMGSRLVRVEGGLTAALLDATLGYKGRLTVMDYESLIGAKLDVIPFLQALNIKADIKALTFDQVLSAPVSVGHIVGAMAETTSDGAVKALLKTAAPLSSNKVILNQVLDLGSLTGLPVNGILSGGTLPISVGELLGASVALADKDHQVAVDLGAFLGDSSIADVSLDLGEKPRVLDYKGKQDKGAKVSTSQLVLKVGALGLVAVDVSLANAKVQIDDIACKADGSGEVVLKATTEAASVGLKAAILPRISVKLGNNETKKLTFTKQDIDAQTYKPVRSGLGLQLGSLSIAQKLLFAPVDGLLEALGLHLAEADVKVVEVDCGSAGLVH